MKKLGSYENALDTMNLAIESEKEEYYNAASSNYFDAAVGFSSIGNYEMAVDCLEKAVETNAKSNKSSFEKTILEFFYTYNLAEVLIRIKKIDVAISVLINAMKLAIEDKLLKARMNLFRERFSETIFNREKKTFAEWITATDLFLVLTRLLFCKYVSRALDDTSKKELFIQIATQYIKILQIINRQKDKDDLNPRENEVYITTKYALANFLVGNQQNALEHIDEAGKKIIKLKKYNSINSYWFIVKTVVENGEKETIKDEIEKLKNTDKKVNNTHISDAILIEEIILMHREKICVNCGGSLPTNAIFCGFCGNKT